MLAVCGKVSPEIRWLIITYTNTWRKQLNFPVMAFFKQDNSGVEQEPEMPTEEPIIEGVE